MMGRGILAKRLDLKSMASLKLQWLNSFIYVESRTLVLDGTKQLSTYHTKHEVFKLDCYVETDCK